MIYCTVSVGEEISKKYQYEINQLSKSQKVVILTDSPQYFNNCEIIHYKRNIFSYYEKLPFLLRLVLENKQRIVYFDVDSINLIDNKFDFDMESVYTYKIFQNENFTIEKLREDSGYTLTLDIYEKLGYKMCNYVHERFISIPYSEKVKSVLDDILMLQPIFEETYSKNKVWKNPSRLNLKRYSETGCGYGEGGALSVVLKNHDINIKSIFGKNLI